MVACRDYATQTFLLKPTGLSLQRKAGAQTYSLND